MSGASNAQIVAVIGASGQGKGVYIKQRLQAGRWPAVLVWSPLEETDGYAQVIGGQVVTGIKALTDALMAGKRRLVLAPGGDMKEQFSDFCRVAWACAGACVVVEELSQVTTPSWAPPAWKKLSTAGRHKGLTLIGASQRPAQVDKDFLGNCTEIRCYGLRYESDARVMGGVLRVDAGELLDLPQFHYRHRTMNDRKTEAGVVKLQQKRRKT